MQRMKPFLADFIDELDFKTVHSDVHTLSVPTTFLTAVELLNQFGTPCWAREQRRLENGAPSPLIPDYLKKSRGLW